MHAHYKNKKYINLLFRFKQISINKSNAIKITKYQYQLFTNLNYNNKKCISFITNQRPKPQNPNTSTISRRITREDVRCGVGSYRGRGKRGQVSNMTYLGAVSTATLYQNLVCGQHRCVRLCTSTYKNMSPKFYASGETRLLSGVISGH